MKIIHQIYDFLQRKNTTEYFWKLRTKILGFKGPKLFNMINKYKYNKLLYSKGSSIPLPAQLKGCPVFPHGIQGIFISAGAQIGEGCTIFHQVTIGSNTLSDSKGAGYPVLGDNVFIGAGAKIIGGVKIGNNVRIGANCVVVKDVPDNSTVVLSPAVVIRHELPRENTFVAFGDYKEDK